MNTKQFLTRHKIRMSCTWADENPHMVSLMAKDQEWQRHASHYRCVFIRDRQRLTTYFSMGPAHTREPTASEVLDCLASDAASIENSKSFEDWASDLGYKEDSRSAERIYQACVRQAEQLERFLGPDLYRELLWDTERE